MICQSISYYTSRSKQVKCQHVTELTLSTMSYTHRLAIRLNEVHGTVRSLDIEDLVAELRLQDYENHINMLSNFNYKPKESGEIFCAVCLSDFQCDEVISKLPCNHEFHAVCVKKWLHFKLTCPICRKRLSDH